MFVSTRTPGGFSHRCPVCGKEAVQWPSLPTGDSVCPHCGSLIWFSLFQEYFSRVTGVAAEKITPDTTFANLGMDSLDIVEMVMELEEEYGFTIPDDEAERIRTIRDLIRRLDEYFGRRDVED